MDTYRKNLECWLKLWPKHPELAFVPKIVEYFPSAAVYLVGGMVRDIALGRASKDFDVVVCGVEAKKLEELLHQLGEVNLVGKNFGVFKFYPKLPSSAKATEGKQAEIDVALPRKEHAFGTGGYRDVNVQSDHRLPVEKDLERRDFTINAMALRLSPLSLLSRKGRGIKGEGTLQATGYKLQANLVDPFGGLDDLAKKTIRCVGKPEERFREDYSRMLRAIRFACQLDFEIEAATWRALKQNVKNLNRSVNGERVVPPEVIAKELVKMLSAHPVWALELLDKSGAIKTLVPELLRMKKCPQPPQFHSEGDVWQHTVLALSKLSSKEFRKEFSLVQKKSSEKKFPISNFQFPIPAELIWATLFHDIGKPYTITFTDRIRTNAHDIKSAKLFREVSDRLKLSSASLDVTAVEQVIAKHLLATHAKKSEMKETTVEKYFYSDRFPGRLLLQLTFVDIGASIPPSGRPDYTCYQQLKRRITSLARRLKTKQTLPPKLLDGHEIMALLKIPPGPKIKEVKEFLREQQLAGKVKTKTQAKAAVVKKFKIKSSK